MASFQSIQQLHQAFEKKEISPVEIVQEYLAAIQISRSNIFLTVTETQATDQAKQLQQELERNGGVPLDRRPLFGVPVGLKDIFTTQGVRTTCGSKILDDYVPPYSATVVQRLFDQGAVGLGKLNMDEFAMGSSNENSAYGPVQNPVKPDRVAGGSSGGSAAAVRQELCMGALGTDTGGSIRLPASFCGVTGLKPTYGRVSRYGLIAFASSLDQAGPLARTVVDAAYLFDAIAGVDSRDSTSAPVEKASCLPAITKASGEKFDWKKVKIGVPKEYFQESIHPDVEKSVDQSLKWLEKQGAKLQAVSLPHTKYAVATYYVVAVAEASSNLARYDGVRFGKRPEGIDSAKDIEEFYQKVRDQFGAEVKRRILLGTFALSSGYYDAYYRKACQVRRLIKSDFDAAFAEVDFIVSPTAASTAFKIGEKSDPLKMYLTDTMTIPASLSGLPAVSLPCGDDSDGLPIGLQVIGKHFSEESLMVVAHLLEQGIGYEW